MSKPTISGRRRRGAAFHLLQLLLTFSLAGVARLTVSMIVRRE